MYSTSFNYTVSSYFIMLEISEQSVSESDDEGGSPSKKPKSGLIDLLTRSIDPLTGSTCVLFAKYVPSLRAVASASLNAYTMVNKYRFTIKKHTFDLNFDTYECDMSLGSCSVLIGDSWINIRGSRPIRTGVETKYASSTNAEKWILALVNHAQYIK